MKKKIQIKIQENSTANELSIQSLNEKINMMKQDYKSLKKESSYQIEKFEKEFSDKIEKLETIIENNKKLYEKKILN